MVSSLAVATGAAAAAAVSLLTDTFHDGIEIRVNRERVRLSVKNPLVE